MTSSDRISPRTAGISSNRHDRPLRSGRVPGGAAATANSPAFIAASAQASPPPENIASAMLSEAAKRATRTSAPCARTAATGTSPIRSVRSSSSLTQAAVAASALRAMPAAEGGTAKLAPSPPNTNGNSRCSSALVIATMTAAPAMLTAL